MCHTGGEKRRKGERCCACHVLAFLPNTLVWVSIFYGGVGREWGEGLLETWRPKGWDQRERQRETETEKEGARGGVCVYVCEAEWIGGLETSLYSQPR